MSDTRLRLPKAPIVEAVLDIECEMPPKVDLESMEGRALEALGREYPRRERQFVQEHTFQATAAAAPKFSVRRDIQALRFRQEDGRQLVQVRSQGFSFNRLAPYSSLDDYLPEIERAWRVFVGLAAPIQVRAVRLRYINRIPIPLGSGRVDLADYFSMGPGIPEEEGLTFVNFLNRFSLVEMKTGHQVNIILAADGIGELSLPVILDIEAVGELAAEPADWQAILVKILALRELKNRTFLNTLTPRCLTLFQS